MNNNDILRRLRYAFDFSDGEVCEMFSSVDVLIEKEQVVAWLKKDDHAEFQSLSDEAMATFLNGFIISRRGRKDGPLPVPESKLDNNIVLKKLKIALNYKSEDMLDVLDLADQQISEHELSAFFRKKGNKHYRVCLDQILRNFLEGLQLTFRADAPAKKVYATPTKRQVKE